MDVHPPKYSKIGFDTSPYDMNHVSDDSWWSMRLGEFSEKPMFSQELDIWASHCNVLASSLPIFFFPLACRDFVVYKPRMKCCILLCITFHCITLYYKHTCNICIYKYTYPDDPWLLIVPNLVCRQNLATLPMLALFDYIVGMGLSDGSLVGE